MAEQHFHLFLLQDFIVHTDRSQLHLELLADVRPTHLWAGMNAGCQSPGSGNTGGVGDIVTKGNPSASCCRLLTFTGPALKNRLLPATTKRHHYEFITASQKENIVLLNNSMYIITMHFLYKAVCIWGKKEACVLLLSLTLVWKCPCTNYPRDRSSSSVIYLINNAHTRSNQSHPAQAAKRTVRMGT